MEAVVESRVGAGPVVAGEAVIRSVLLRGLEPVLVRVTARVASVGRGWAMPGTGDARGREARVRIMAALASLGVLIDPYRVQIACDIGGSAVEYRAHFDLAAALAVLAALGHSCRSNEVFVGELGLDGRLRPARGALPMARLEYLRAEGYALVAPAENAPELGLAPSGILLAGSLQEALHYLSVGADLPAPQSNRSVGGAGKDHLGELARIEQYAPAVSALRQHALAGAGRVLLVGGLGSGLTALADAAARTVAELPLGATDRQVVASLQSAAGLAPTAPGPWDVRRLLRAPHHSVSDTGLAGGGQWVPEASVAHMGVLVLRDLPEFRRRSVEALAVALRAGETTARKDGATVTYPARPSAVIATARSCLCGQRGYRGCGCSEEQIARHEQRIEDFAWALGLHVVRL